MLLSEKYVYEEPDEQICLRLKLRTDEYKIKLHQAEKKFIGIIENSAGLTNIMGDCQSVRINADS